MDPLDRVRVAESVPNSSACSREKRNCRPSTSFDASVVSNDRRWKSFVLTGYGFRSYNNIRLCPETWRICQNIPGLITVLFSILEPGKHLPAHRGPYNGVLRLHLGLIVPEPRERLGIRVENQIYR